MNRTDLILIGMAILCIVEAYLEDVVIQLKNPGLINYNQLNKREHQLSGLYWMALCLFLVIIFIPLKKWYFFVPLLLIIRRIFFEFTLKLLRYKRFQDIEGDQFWDTVSRTIFGAKGGWIELMALLVTGTLLYLIPQN